MTTPDEVKKLAALARIEVSDADTAAFAKDFDGILAYVGQLEALEVPEGAGARPPVRNVLRKDGDHHEKGAFTERLVGQFPERDGDYLKVKQIISYD